TACVRPFSLARSRARGLARPPSTGTRSGSHMLAVIFIAAVLVAITVAVHAAGLAVVLSHLVKSHARPPTQAWPITLLLVRVTWLLILIHAVEIAVWALFYRWEGCLSDVESAF